MDKTVILAYSGGLDTSFLIPYLCEKHQVKVICATIDTGGLDSSRAKEIVGRARELGAQDAVVIDAKESYFREVITYLIKGNVLRGGVYPLCVGAERVIQAKELAKIAREKGALAIVHGSTAAGNDQVRFEIYLRILAPQMEIWAPIRDQGFKREEEVEFLKNKGFDFPWETARFSTNTGLWGKTIGSREIQDPSKGVPEEAYTKAENKAFETLTLDFEKGIPTALDHRPLSPVEIIEELERKGNQHGIGRGIHIGNTVLGIKGRIAFEAPAATILLEAHRELEKLVLTKWESFWKGQLSNFYGEMLHEGHYFDPVMKEIEAFLDKSQERVSGWVKVGIGKGQVRVDSCQSPFSLVNGELGVYGEEACYWTGQDALGFSKISSISSQLWQRIGNRT